MIYDRIENLPLWAEKIPSLKRALAESKKVADAPFSLGKTIIDGDDLFASSSEYAAEARDTKNFENHHVYIDVQMLIEGEEQIDVIIAENVNSDYSADKDVEFASFDSKFSTVTLRTGDFLILMPGEWHRPGVGNGTKCRKIVAKIRK